MTLIKVLPPVSRMWAFILPSIAHCHTRFPLDASNEGCTGQRKGRGDPGAGGMGHYFQWLGYNSLDNAVVNNGLCIVESKEEDVVRKAVDWRDENEILADGLPNLRSYSYTSSNVWSKYRFGLGRYEMRFRIQNAKGLLPAFWNFNAENEIWNEIDFFEIYGNEDQTWTGTVHHDIDGDGCSEKCPASIENAADFNQWHTIVCEVDFDHITWILDGNTILRHEPRYVTAAGNQVQCGDDIAVQTLFQNAWWPYGESHIIFNTTIHGGINGIDATTLFPAYFYIDFIRFYKKEGCCGDIVISDNSDFELDPHDDVFNYICAENILVSSNATLNANENITLIAKEEIVFEPGFVAEEGSYIETMIEPDVVPCCPINITLPLTNVFTPNGDGVNDNYCVLVTGASSYNVYVYESCQGCGSLVYSGSGSISPGQTKVCVWDGDGQPSGGIFAIVVEFYNSCNDQPVGAGTTVHLFRSQETNNDSSENELSIHHFESTQLGYIPSTNPHSHYFTQKQSYIQDVTLPLSVNSPSQLQPSFISTQEEIEVRLIPNPSSDLFAIVSSGSWGDGSNVEIYNSIGEMVLFRTITSDKDGVISVSSLSDGLYNVIIRIEDEIVFKKLMVTK